MVQSLRNIVVTEIETRLEHITFMENETVRLDVLSITRFAVEVFFTVILKMSLENIQKNRLISVLNIYIHKNTA